jgi:SAM-dependent methyltransferase
MPNHETTVAEHYHAERLAERILEILADSGVDIATLSREDLFPVDEFHIRGRAATRELSAMLGLHQGTRLLDCGSGIGGPARTFAAEAGAIVTGIDLVAEYCRTAGILSDKVGMTGQVQFQQGSVTDLPFDDNAFDAAVTIHTSMNVPDKARFFSEVHRTLKPGGLFGVYEICAGSNTPIHLPVPWASSEEINVPATAETIRGLLTDSGFTEQEWNDVSAASLEWFSAMVANMSQRPTDAPPQLGINLLMGTTTPEKAHNVVRNLKENRITVMMATYRRND